jgi:hypothetical protein
VSLVCLAFYVLGSHTLGLDCTTTRDFLNDTSTPVIDRVKEGTTVEGDEVHAEFSQDVGTYSMRTSQTCVDDNKFSAHLTDMYDIIPGHLEARS